MQYTTYGNTGVRVSTVGFGGMRFDLDRSLEENAELVRYAARRGITYFDTAPGYCGDKSEDIFGLAFRDMPGDFLVSTKGMPGSVPSADKARDLVLRSIERLGVEKIDFYHVWCLRKMEHYDLAVRPGGQYEGLMRCREEGLIDHVVCSTHQIGPDVRTVLSKNEFEGVLLGVNVLNFPYRSDGIKAAREAGCGVVAMNPLGGGTIPRHPQRFAFLCEEGETPVEAALRFALGHPGIDICLVGFTTRDHVDTACHVADRAAAMDEDEIARIQSHLTANLETICTGCGYCRDCPVDIPVPAYMQYYNEKILFGKSADDMVRGLGGQKQYGLLVERPAEAAACTQCGACRDACTQSLPIVDRLEEVAAWEART